MAIEFHCHHCGHLVRTANEHAGRRGKCPHCHNSVYIPTPSEEIEPLPLAPLNEADEREKKRLEEESRRLARALLEDKTELPPESASRAPAAQPLGDVRLPGDMEVLVTEYVLAMAEGRLAEAEDLALEIRMDMKRAEEYIQRLSIDQIPPQRLAKIPRPVLLGFLKQLRGH